MGTFSMRNHILGVAAAITLASPLAAQDPGNEPQTPESYEGTVYDGDWMTLGAGAILNPSYDGSDDYVISPVPFVQGNLLGVGINPRGAGLALDFIPDGDNGVNVNLGVAARLNRNRVTRIKDPVVFEYGKLKSSIMVGPTAGLSFPHVLNPYDSLSFNADVLFDVSGASKGTEIDPSVTYFTPVSKGAAISFSLSARHVDDKYARYYYSVPVAPATVPVADRLPVFNASGGFDKVGATLLAGVDFDGDLTNGGLAGFLLGGYSKMIGDAADTPFTSIRGSDSQWLVGAGLAYTF
jgi:outer membrane scaffolding protein for murein synthesis (MipA/OmpV family)